MKKILMTSLILTAAVALAFGNGADEADTTLKIGITKIVAHPALDSLEQGVMETVLAEYPDAVFDNQNANGDMATASTIAQKFKSDKVDLAVGIATPTAVALANTIQDAPIVFCAVTDPVDAGLVPSWEESAGNVTGYSDMTPVKEQITLLNSLMDLKVLGHVYCSSEANAVRLAEIAEQTCNELGIEFVPTAVSTSAEVKQAAQSIAGRIDAFYVSNDNTVVSALAGLSDAASQAGIPVLSADPTSAADNEVFLAWGYDYYKMGLATGKLVLKILAGADPASIPTQLLESVEDFDLVLNLKVAEKLGIEVPADLVEKAGTVIE